MEEGGAKECVAMGEVSDLCTLNHRPGTAHPVTRPLTKASAHEGQDEGEFHHSEEGEALEDDTVSDPRDEEV